MAILKFRVYFRDDETVYRDIAIKHVQRFLDLHHAILKSFEFDSKHAATFARSNDAWQRGREISFERYDKQYKAEPLMMADTLIGAEIRDPNQKFLYDYDFVKGWQFMLELINVEKEENSKLEYPAVVRSEGIAPSQYGTKGLVDKRLAEMEEKYDLKNESLEDGFGEEGEERAESSDAEETHEEDSQAQEDF